MVRDMQTFRTGLRGGERTESPPLDFFTGNGRPLHKKQDYLEDSSGCGGTLPPSAKIIVVGCFYLQIIKTRIKKKTHLAPLLNELKAGKACTCVHMPCSTQLSAV